MCKKYRMQILDQNSGWTNQPVHFMVQHKTKNGRILKKY